MAESSNGRAGPKFVPWVVDASGDTLTPMVQPFAGDTATNGIDLSGEDQTGLVTFSLPKYYDPNDTTYHGAVSNTEDIEIFEEDNTDDNRLSDLQDNPNYKGVLIIINVSSIDAAASFIPRIQTYDTSTNLDFYTVANLVDTAITDEGKHVFHYGQNIKTELTSNTLVTDEFQYFQNGYLPRTWYLQLLHQGTGDIETQAWIKPIGQ